ncbi:MAG TPA: 50S ribosomal protein L30 [Bacillota bacterium]|nr:50S ribosomal protein L30 [Bacillota bacterium]
MKSRVKVTCVRSGVRTSLRHRRTLRALGLRKLGQSMLHVDCPSLRGMLRLVAHLVSVEEVARADGGEAMASPTSVAAVERSSGGKAGAPRAKRTASKPASTETIPAGEGGRPDSAPEAEAKPTATRKRATGKAGAKAGQATPDEARASSAGAAAAEAPPAPKPAARRKKKTEDS